jgi:hypothetical protein
MNDHDETTRLMPEEAADFGPQTEHAVTQLVNRLFVATLCIGLAGGLLSGLLRGLPVPATVNAASQGFILAALAGFLGGFLGELTRDGYRFLRWRTRGTSPLALEGIVIGMFGGSFLGLLGCYIFLGPAYYLHGVGFGALGGSFLGALPGAVVGMVVASLTRARSPRSAAAPMLDIDRMPAQEASADESSVEPAATRAPRPARQTSPTRQTRSAMPKDQKARKGKAGSRSRLNGLDDWVDEHFTSDYPHQ